MARLIKRPIVKVNLKKLQPIKRNSLLLEIHQAPQEAKDLELGHNQQQQIQKKHQYLTKRVQEQLVQQEEFPQV